MNYAFVRMKQRRRIVTPAAAALRALGGFALPTPAASADAVAYLVNVTVRPGYNFANADQALAYGHEVCDKIAAGRQAGPMPNPSATSRATSTWPTSSRRRM
ncbi:MAG: hypothetical protein NVSMB60_32310 [Mycobacterium sp.]